jgi:hypothetical protein
MDLNCLAKIAKGTGRKKREINLLEVAEAIQSLYISENSLSKVAKTVKLSPEMVRQFLKINDLDENVKELIKNGFIKGVDIGYRISKIKTEDQIIFAKHIIDENISSKDVRLIVSYKIANYQIPLEEIINTVIQSKDKKIYVAYLGIKNDTFEKLKEKIGNKDIEKILESIFNSIVPDKFITKFELNGRIVIIKVLYKGMEEIRNNAKKLKIPLSQLADALVREYLKGNKL